MVKDPKLVAINEQNKAFWDEQTKLRDRRMADRSIRTAALSDIHSEYERGVPVRSQKTLEKALEDAESTKRLFLQDQARAGGRAKRPDPLQSLIDKIVSEQPKITESQLRRALKQYEHTKYLYGIEDGMLQFERPDGSLKEVPLSGLKHRLTRARKKFSKS